MRKLEEIISDLNNNIPISNSEIFELCKHIDRLRVSNLALSDCIRDLCDRLEMVDPFYNK